MSFFRSVFNVKTEDSSSQEQRERGLLVCIEGIDRSGKATQAKRLIHTLFNKGHGGSLVSFPRYSEGVFGPKIKELLVAETRDELVLQALMTADRYDAVERSERMRKTGCNLILDRYWQSGYAYGVAAGLDPGMLIRIHECLPQADVNILIDLPVEVAASRRPPSDSYEKDLALLNKASCAYLSLWNMMLRIESSHKWLVVPGDQPVDAIHEVIWWAVHALL